MWNPVQSLCNKDDPSDLSSNDAPASGLELSKFTVSSTTITTDTPELTATFCISTEELEEDIMNYTNEGNEVVIDSPDDYSGLVDYYCCPEPLSIVAEGKA